MKPDAVLADVRHSGSAGARLERGRGEAGGAWTGAARIESMSRFTIRDVLWLTVVVAMGVAVWFERSAQDNDRRAAIHRASEQELAAISARYKAAKGEFDFHVTRWHSPVPPERAFGFYHWPVDDTCGAIERLAYATEASNDLETQVKDLKSALELAEFVLSMLLEKVAEDVLAVHRAQYTRAGVEAQLRRAEQDLTAARTVR
jgi:hypothetical protein